MKKITIGIFLVVIILFFTSCGNITQNKEKKDKKLIYTTFYPVYDFTSRIVEDKMQVEMIVKSSDSPHNFKFKAREMAEIAKANLIIYNGADMEVFIKDLKAVVKNDDKFLDLSKGIKLLEQEKGKENEEHNEDSHNHENVNPHIWLSPKNAIIELKLIYKKVVSIDPENKAYYSLNYKKALKEFEALDKLFTDKISKISKKDKYFVTSHSSFNYLARDYGLKQVAVTGISADEEPTAKKMKTIIDFVRKHKINTIFFEEKSTSKVAQTLSRETGIKIFVMLSLEKVTKKEAKLGYVKLMEQNLNLLLESFND